VERKEPLTGEAERFLARWSRRKREAEQLRERLFAEEHRARKESEKARAEYRELFELAGVEQWLDEITSGEEKPVCLRYVEGRIVDE